MITKILKFIVAACLFTSWSALAADWSKPALTDTYTNFLTYQNNKINDAALWLDSAVTAPANTPTNAKRWNAASYKFEKWNGTAWVDLTSLYGISILGNAASATNASQLGGYAVNVGTAANTIPVRNASGQIPGDITGNAATATSANSATTAQNAVNATYATNAGTADMVDGYHANTSAVGNTIPVRDASGVIPGTCSNANTASNADMVDGYHANASAVANNVAVRDSSGVVPGTCTNANTVGGYAPTATANTPNTVVVRDSSGLISGGVSADTASYATNAGYATSAGNADTVDGKHASDLGGMLATPVTGTWTMATNTYFTVPKGVFVVALSTFSNLVSVEYYIGGGWIGFWEYDPNVNNNSTRPMITQKPVVVISDGANTRIHNSDSITVNIYYIQYI